MDYPDSMKGEINSFRNSVKQIKTDDIWVFANSITEQQKIYFQKLELEYRFHKDDKALERLASKIGMDLTNIGYEMMKKVKKVLGSHAAVSILIHVKSYRRDYTSIRSVLPMKMTHNRHP